MERLVGRGLLIFSGGLILVLIWCYSNAESEYESIRTPENNPRNHIIRTLCVEGYTFVLYTADEKAGLSQMLILNDNGNLAPATCTESSPPSVIETNEKPLNPQVYIVFLAIACISFVMLLIAYLDPVGRKKTKSKPQPKP